MIGIVFALISAAMSGLSIVLARKHSSGSNAFNMSLIITCVGMVILWPLAIMLTAFGTVNLEGFLFFALSGVLSPGIVRLLYYRGMRTLGASVTSSIYSIYPLYSTLFAVMWLNEILSIWNMLGIICIVLGIIFMEMNSYRKNGQDKGRWKNIIFPLLGGLTFGVSSVIRKYALDICNTPILGVAIGYTFALLPYALILLSSAPTRRQLKLKRDLNWFWIAGVSQAITWTLAYYALSFEQVSITTPLLSIEPLFVVGFAYLYLKKIENVTHQLLGSVILTVLGVVLIIM
jgi:drug/metabolite transporter (DMT)-like permease